MLGNCMPAIECLPPTIKDEMQVMYLRLDYSQTVVEKHVVDQGIDFPCTLASLSDKDISEICDVIRRPGGIVTRSITDRGSQISVVVAKDLNLAMFILKTMEC